MFFPDKCVGYRGVSETGFIWLMRSIVFYFSVWIETKLSAAKRMFSYPTSWTGKPHFKQKVSLSLSINLKSCCNSKFSDRSYKGNVLKSSLSWNFDCKTYLSQLRSESGDSAANFHTADENSPEKENQISFVTERSNNNLIDNIEKC